jgi:hypothetical protein
MPALDFKEIARANAADGEQDQFELFAREVLAGVGYKILSGPGRGPDAGRDLMVAEIREGIAGRTEVKWLVSCKHFSHTGASVGVADEDNIRDRVDANSCNAFLGFYSTLPSAGLVTRYEGLRAQIEVQCLDRESIERILLTSAFGLGIAARFFPVSFAAWQQENPQPARLFSDLGGLRCENCGKELLTASEKSGIVVIWRLSREGEPRLVYDVYWSCKDTCDQVLRKRYMRPGSSDGWEDIPDITIPQVYMKWVIATINQLHDKNVVYSDEALEKVKTLLVEIFPYVARQLSMRERQVLSGLQEIPAWMGGMG